MTQHWELRTLAEVCEINPSREEVQSLPDNTDVSFVPMAAVSEEGELTNPSVRRAGELKRGFPHFKERDVLVAKITPCFENGKRCLASGLVNGIGFGSTEFHVIRAKNSVLPEWVYYAVSSEEFRRTGSLRMTGTAGQKRVPSSFLKEYNIPVPPIPIQRKIVSDLDRVHRARALRTQADALTGSFLKSLFSKMFGDLHHNNGHFDIEKLDDLKKEGTIITYGIVQAGPHVEGGVPYIKTGDIQNGSIVESGLSRTDRKLAEKFRRSEVHFGDLVYSIRATVGTVALLPKSLDGANLTQGTAKVSPGPRVNKHYLLWYLRSSGCQAWIKSRVKGVTFLEITLATLRRTPILVPPLPLQQKFAFIAEELEGLVEYQNASHRELDDLERVTMQKAFGRARDC